MSWQEREGRLGVDKPKVGPHPDPGLWGTDVEKPLHLAIGWGLQCSQIKLKLVMCGDVLIGRRWRGWVQGPVRAHQEALVLFCS